LEMKIFNQEDGHKRPPRTGEDAMADENPWTVWVYPNQEDGHRSYLGTGRPVMVYVAMEGEELYLGAAGLQ
jgi:hypothetical protein